jgi:hypothetical protein
MFVNIEFSVNKKQLVHIIKGTANLAVPSKKSDRKSAIIAESAECSSAGRHPDTR